MNLSLDWSCADGSDLSRNSVSAEYWRSAGTEYRTTSLISAAVNLLFILVGIPSNLFIIVSILWQKFYEEPTYILLLNLSIVDLLTCMLVMPFTVISGFYGEYPFGSTDTVRCKVCQVGILFHLFGINSIHLRAFLSLDRFIFIKFAMKYHKLATSKFYVGVCICLWVFVSIISIMPLFGVGDMEFFITVSACTLKLDGQTNIMKNKYYNIILAIEMTIPIVILAVTNIWTVCIVRKQIKKVYQSCEAPSTFRETIRNKVKNLKQTKQLKLIKVFGAITIATAISSSPFVIVVMSTVFSSHENFPKWFILIAFLSLISFPVVHPIIEAALIPELKKVLTVLLSKLRCHRQGAISRFSLESVGEDIVREELKEMILVNDKHHLKVAALLVPEVSSELSSVKD